jgi:hypothetical protein
VDLIVVVTGGLAHLEDRRAQEAEPDDIAADATHDDAVSDGEDVAAQDEEVTGERRDRLLQRERGAGGEDAERGGRVQPVVEPDRQQPEHDEDRSREIDALPSPEPRRRVHPPAQQQPDHLTRGPAQRDEADDEDRGVEQLCRRMPVHPDQVDVAERGHVTDVP